MLSKLWKDEAGFVVSAELIFVATLLVIGLVAGWQALRNAVTSELAEVGYAINALDNGYTISGRSYCGTYSNGTSVTDTTQTGGFAAVTGTPFNINVTNCP